jgi:hypothetical protein
MFGFSFGFLVLKPEAAGLAQKQSVNDFFVF